MDFPKKLTNIINSSESTLAILSILSVRMICLESVSYKFKSINRSVLLTNCWKLISFVSESTIGTNQLNRNNSARDYKLIGVPMKYDEVTVNERSDI